MSISKSSRRRTPYCPDKTAKLCDLAGRERFLINSDMKIMRRALVLILSIQLSTPIWAVGEDAFQFFQEEAKVVTASRREQPICEAPVAIDVITAEEIKASGATNLWDVMRFRPGMDVLDGRTYVDNRALVSVRG